MTSCQQYKEIVSKNPALPPAWLPLKYHFSMDLKSDTDFTAYLSARQPWKYHFLIDFKSDTDFPTFMVIFDSFLVSL